MSQCSPHASAIPPNPTLHWRLSLAPPLLPLLLLPLLLALACCPVVRCQAVSESADSPSSSFPPSPVVSLSDATFEPLTQASSGATSGTWLVQFYAPWELVAADLSGAINVAKVDATAATSTATRFAIRSYPTLLYLARGRMFEYAGDRSRADLVNWALAKHRGGRRGTGGTADTATTTQPQGRDSREEGEAEAVEGEVEHGGDGGRVDADAAEDAGVNVEERGLPVPPVPSSWDVLRSSFDAWANQLSYVVTAQPTVAAALLLMGALIGLSLSLLVLALTLGDRRPPPHYQSIPHALADAAHATTNPIKPVKGE